MARKDPLLIAVYSNGQRIGAITSQQFMKFWNGPRNQFVDVAMEQFNAAKVAANEPERVQWELQK